MSDVAANGRDGTLRCLSGKVRSVMIRCGTFSFGFMGSVSVCVCVYARKAPDGSPIVCWWQIYMDVCIKEICNAIDCAQVTGAVDFLPSC